MNLEIPVGSSPCPTSVSSFLKGWIPLFFHDNEDIYVEDIYVEDIYI